MKRVVLTGSSGFLGQRIASQLQADGYAVEAPGRSTLDVTLADHWSRLAETPAPFALVLAAAVAPNTDATEALLTGALSVKHALDFAARSGARRVVYCSSWSVYAPSGVASLPLSEDAPVGPVGPMAHYSLGKLWGEQLCSLATASRPNFATSLRLSSLYGRGMRPGVARSFFEHASDAKPIPVMAPNASADFLYVDDAARAVVCAVSTDEVAQIYNIGTGHETTLAELAGAAWLAHRPTDRPTLSLGNKNGRRLYLDVHRAAKDLGFVASHDVRSGMLAWARGPTA